MAEKTNVEKLGSLADFKAPWETEAGEVEIDKAKLKQYLYNGALDKAKNQDARIAAEAAVIEAEEAKKVAETDAKKARKELAESDATGKIAELTETSSNEKDRADKAEGQLLRITVGAEKGLSIKQSLRLQGETEDELKADADEIATLFGLKSDETDEEREAREEREAEEAEESGGIRTEPRRLVGPTGGAKVEDGPRTEAEFAAAVAAAQRPRFL